MIFVFGSNMAGHHGAGAARVALDNYGAIYGQASGRQGDSYAIPTKDRHLRTWLYVLIEPYVHEFVDYARYHPAENFKITQLGCGYAGLNPATMASMFRGATSNCYFDRAWADHLPEATNFWGTYR